jgi:hypothetical protein
LSRLAKIVPTEGRPKPCKSPVGIYLNADGSWYAFHFHGGGHGGLKHPVTPEQVRFLDIEEK